jgi:hypothetical protein
MDRRYQVLKERLSLLTNEELVRIKTDIDQVCLDTYNYDTDTDTYCPLGVALNLHNTIKNPSDNLVKGIIAETGRFIPVNVIGGVEGTFYKDNRRVDLLLVVEEILSSRQVKRSD